MRIAVTQDGGKPGVLQHFVGPQCGGNGWVLFRQDAPTGSWTEMVARLSNNNDGSCPASLGRAYTRWRIEDKTWTLYFGRQPERVTLPTIVSEHYNRVTIADATALERFYFAKGVGRIRWSAWNKTGHHADPIRCPAVPYDDPPDASSWALADCRTWTAIEPPEDPTWSASRFDWPQDKRQSTHDLRVAWRRVHRTEPALGISRDLLIRALAHQLQESAHGGASGALRRRLQKAAGPPIPVSC